ncbi:MAG: hypothetical protein R3277_12145 [Brumimicrobium sp.]|nr:hypothetical protein [Brumimicrobium sp.]
MIQTNYPETKKRMIEEITAYSDFYRSANELNGMSFSLLKSVYHSCMIPLLKRLNSNKS